MGKLIKNIVTEHIKKYDDALSSYSEFFTGVPSYTTYYHKDILNSDQDATLESVVEFIGSESPIKYKKIENFVLYNMEEIKLSLDEGDFGISAGGGSTAVVPPNSIKPLPNDYFFIDYNSKEFRFRVINVDASKMNGVTFYQIEFELVSSDIDIDQHVSEELIQQTKNDGISNNTIVSKTEFSDLSLYKKISKQLIKTYVDLFFNNHFKLPLLDNENTLFYDNFLAWFIYENKLLSLDEVKGTFFKPVFNKSSSFLKVYNETLFKALEEDDKDIFRLDKVNYLSIPKGTVFDYSYISTLCVDYCIDTTFNFLSLDIKDSINNNVETSTILDILVLYFNDKEKLKDSFINYLENIETVSMNINFYLMPIVLFILKEFILEIEKNSNETITGRE